MKKISVIVTVYNQEKYIGRCLRSLLRQNIDKETCEIIVVDDGSTDKTAYALELFCGDITMVTHDINRGLPSAVNSGLKVATGDYIIRVDSDDYVNENFLVILQTYLDFNEKSHAVGCDYYVVDEFEKVISRESSQKKPIACGIMFKKSAINDIGMMNEDFFLNEEKEFRQRFEKKYEIDHLSIPLYRYRRHKNNLTNDHERLKFYDKKLKKNRT
jgi:glycosyltransferase involved in cell wall biosynthesis